MNKQTLSKKIKIIITVVIISILAAAVVFFASDAFYSPVEHFGYAMGSEIVVYFYGADNRDVADDIFSQIAVLDTEKLSAKSEKSEIYTLNKNGSHALSEETLSYLKRATEICGDSDGALDITIGGLSSLWDFDSSKNQVPDFSLIETELSYCGYKKPVFDGYTVTLGEKQTIDLGALGKGIACDTAKKVLEENNIKRALISVGGTVMTYSDGNAYHWHDGWGIAVRTPEAGNSSPLLRIHLTGTKVVSTSGNYEKFFEENGMLYHHILNPETGYPADTGLKSVTIITDDGLVSDALSTACFVLGKENSSELLKKYNAEAVFVDTDNNVYITNGIFEDCTLLNEDYKVFEYE